MNRDYLEIERHMKEASAIGSAAGLLGWDQETMMPPKAAGSRAEQSAALAGVIHDKIVDKRIGRLLKGLARRPGRLSPDRRVCVREWLRDHTRAAKVPRELVQELARVTTLAHQAWIKARRARDFKAFSPWLRKVVALIRREAECVGYKGHPYDALLDQYEPGMTVEKLDPIVRGLAEGLAPIAKRLLASKNHPDNSILKRGYPEREQEALCRDVMEMLGVDAEASRMDRSVHPFCCGIAPTDVRITTRYDERWLPAALYGVIHESGHALYEQGLPAKHLGTPLAEAVSLGIHESQSRFWENVVGRSLPFARLIVPMLRKRFPRQMAKASPEEFYRALCRVKSTPIRVESDEVTYNLHIVLRYGLEKDLIAGEIGVDDLPGLWNEGMASLLGITPGDDAQGVLQDTHWSDGLIGYFPTYLIGNLAAAQLWARMRRDIPRAEAMIARGRLEPILGWLRERIHRHGRRYRTSELLERATGEPLDQRHFLDYVESKYGSIYGMDRGA
ncbi:MAG: carboxypeptidase M32 [Proteobacteria bacterium]|nr:carboxypeptidase M32 [Pseudomonadota bacterium]